MYQSPSVDDKIWQMPLSSSRSGFFSRIGLSLLSGILLGFYGALFHKGFHWIGWFAFVPLLFGLVDSNGDSRVLRGFGYGFLTGIVAIGGGFYWVIDLLVSFGNLPLWIAIAIYLLFVSYHAILFACFAALLVWLRRQTYVSLTFLVALSWACCEFLFPCIFPWYLSMGQVAFRPLLQIADITGPLGIGFCLLLVNAALVEFAYVLYRKKFTFQSLRSPIAGFVVVIGVLIYGNVRINQITAQMKQSPSLQVGVVQGNFGIADRTGSDWVGRQEEIYRKKSLELVSKGAQLLVWPESSYLRRVVRPPHMDMSPFVKLQNELHTPLILGVWSYDFITRTNYNTALYIDSQGRLLGKSDKNYLLIFGEYYPFANLFPQLKELIPAMSVFKKGTQVSSFTLPYQDQSFRIAPLICYEDILPHFVNRLFSQAEPPHLLVNITIESWFGDTVEPYQHFALAALRAVENRTYLIRSVDTGISAVVDPTGFIQEQTQVAFSHSKDEHKVATGILAKVALMSPRKAIPLETFGILCWIVLLLLAVLVFYRSKQPIQFSWMIFTWILLAIGFILAGLLLHEGDLKVWWNVFICSDDFSLTEQQRFSIVFKQQIIFWVISGLLGFLWARTTDIKKVKALRFSYVVQSAFAFFVALFIPVFLWGDLGGNTAFLCISFLMCLTLTFFSSFLGVLGRHPH